MFQLEFYKAQNAELIQRLDEFEIQLDQSILQRNQEGQLGFQSKEQMEDSLIHELNSSYQHTTRMLKGQNNANQETIALLKSEIGDLEAKCQRHEQLKVDLEYNLRAAEYNVEILKNQLDNVYTEQMLMKKQNEKQQSQISAVRQVNQRIRQDMEYLKKGKRPPARPKFDLNSSAFMDLSNSSFRQSLCPSEISASPFLVDLKESDCQTDLTSAAVTQMDQEIHHL